MEAVFCRFDSYDFQADRRFVDGLKTAEGLDLSKQLDMKLFFYNRFVEPINRTCYKQWSSASPRVTPEAGQADRRTLLDPDSDISRNQTAEICAETEVKQLSFAEVIRLVQEGKEVPGAEKLDVKPSNQSPTPSVMERRVKPWETLSDSK